MFHNHDHSTLRSQRLRGESDRFIGAVFSNHDPMSAIVSARHQAQLLGRQRPMQHRTPPCLQVVHFEAA
jgi:hypothetical protein